MQQVFLKKDVEAEPQYRFRGLGLSKPMVSIILLDWSVRESFHVLDYLNKQDTERDLFEIIWIEYYHRSVDKISSMLEKSMKSGGYPVINQWIVMNMPQHTYYHKHLMYNIGIASARGKIVTIVDSDCMVKPSFVSGIMKEFKKDENIVLHIDEFRNINKKYYPFNYPKFEEILGNGCINNVNGVTAGVVFREQDCLHLPNYGACFSAWREDLISIGGADEHIDYLGHICGPYDMTFRLINLGRREVWDTVNFIYHTWHPGTDGIGNFTGPHDGMNMSSTALDIISSGRTTPLKMSNIINKIKEGYKFDGTNASMKNMINMDYYDLWNINNIHNNFMEEKNSNIFPFARIFRYKEYYLAVPNDNHTKSVSQTKNFYQLLINNPGFLLVEKSLESLLKRLLNECDKIKRNKIFFLTPRVSLYTYYCKNFLENLDMSTKNKTIYICTTDGIMATTFNFLIKKNKRKYLNVKAVFVTGGVQLIKKMIKFLAKNKDDDTLILISIDFIYLKNDFIDIGFPIKNIIFKKVNKNFLVPPEDFFKYYFYTDDSKDHPLVVTIKLFLQQSYSEFKRKVKKFIKKYLQFPKNINQT